MASFKNGTRSNGKSTNGVYRRLEDSVVGTPSPTDTHVLALDVGTTTLRCYVYDKDINIKGVASRQVSVY